MRRNGDNLNPELEYPYEYFNKNYSHLVNDKGIIRIKDIEYVVVRTNASNDNTHKVILFEVRAFLYALKIIRRMEKMTNGKDFFLSSFDHLLDYYKV